MGDNNNLKCSSNALLRYLNQFEKKQTADNKPQYTYLTEKYEECTSIYQRVLSAWGKSLIVLKEEEENIITLFRKCDEQPLSEKDSEEYRLHCINFLNGWKGFVETFEVKRITLLGNVISKVKDLSEHLKDIEVIRFWGIRTLLSIGNVIDNLMLLADYLHKRKTGSTNVDLFSYGFNVLNITTGNFIFQLGSNILGIIKGTSLQKAFRSLRKHYPRVRIVKGPTTAKYIDQICNNRLYLDVAEYAYGNSTHLFGSKYSFYKDYNLGIDAKGFFSDMGLNGCILRNNAENEIIIGFSGTRVPLSYVTDISQVVGLSPTYIRAVGLVKYIKDKEDSVVVCGHSLGGGLAQFAAAPHNGEVAAFCYNAAGLFENSLNLVKRNKYNLENILHLRMRKDWVSCLGNLLGYVLEIDSSKGYCESHSLKNLRKEFFHRRFVCNP